MALVVATLLLNWIMICLAHLRFRAAMRRQGVKHNLRRCSIRSATIFASPSSA